jgi:hypothetical protein
VSEALSEFQGKIASALGRLEAHGHITGLECRGRALGDERLADMLFELNGEAMLVMVADQSPDSVRVVGQRREVDVAPADLQPTLLGWAQD